MPASSPFHHGEQAFQIMEGGMDMRAASEQLGNRLIRAFMPDQHREFFATQQLMYFAAQDPGTGAVWASVLAGPHGFVSSPSPQLLAIAAGSNVFGDPAMACLKPGSYIGLLGLDLLTRRRNRMNGTVSGHGQRHDGSLLIAVDQSFGNCPKYIQTRKVELDPLRLQHMSTEARGSVEQGTGAVGPEQQRLVSTADTFFLATTSTSIYSTNRPSTSSHSAAEACAKALSKPICSNEESAPLQPASAAATGLDVSHRGGSPGFVVLGRNGLTLQWADYNGNDMFNSLGNLAVNPAAGLLFIDWATGDTLQLTGQAFVCRNDSSLPGGKRTVVFEVAAWRHAHAAVPIKQATFLEASPHNPSLNGHNLVGSGGDLAGSGGKLVKTGGSAGKSGGSGASSGGEWLACVDVRLEAAGIKSYFFEASAAMRAAMAAGQLPHQPGQYASFDFQLPAGTASSARGQAASSTAGNEGGAMASAGSTATAAGSAAAAGSSTAATHIASAAPSGISNSNTAAASKLVLVNRTWTISSHPAETAATGRFSITVKRAGLVSSHLWEAMWPGGRVLFRGVGGTFTLAGGSRWPALFIAGGIGITPLRSMFLDCVKQHRPATIIYCVRSASEAAFLQELTQTANAANAAAAVAGAAASRGAAELASSAAQTSFRVCLTVTGGPTNASEAAVTTTATAFEGTNVQRGRVSAALLQQVAPDSAKCDVYLCGPAPFMEAVTAMCKGQLGHAREPLTEAFDF